MNGGILPLLILCATVGLTLSRTTRRVAWIAIAGLAASGLPMSLVPLPVASTGAVFAGLWLSVIAAAVLTYVPRRLTDRWALAVAINGGAWAGALASLSDMRLGLAAALMLGLIFIPGQWIASRSIDFAVKVAASWMIAIASLAMLVSFVPTPGYKPDHMQ
ncbi:MAG: hypothetical protein ACR2FK_05420 [Sphingomicrobium sp.]